MIKEEEKNEKGSEKGGKEMIGYEKWLWCGTSLEWSQFRVEKLKTERKKKEGIEQWGKN